MLKGAARLLKVKILFLFSGISSGEVCRLSDVMEPDGT